MATIAPTPVPAGPAVPDSSNSESTFDAQWEAFNAWAKNYLQPGVNALADNVYSNASEVFILAATATSQAATATAKAALTAADATQTALDRAAASASAASAAAIAGAFVGTSTTSWAPAIGSKTFATQTGEQYTPGVFLSVVSAATPADWGMGQVTSYSGSTLVLDIQVIGGSGAHADWNISLAGVRGAPGATGPESVPTASAGGTVNAITASFSPAITLTDKQKCCVVLAGSNTTTTPTFAPDGLTARTITKRGGAALSVGDLPGALAAAMLIYNAANTRWELLNPATVPVLATSGGWTISEAGGMLYFNFGGVVKARLDQSGNFMANGNNGANAAVT